MSMTAFRSAMQIIATIDVTPCAKLVLIALANRHNQETGRCDPSIERIASDLGISARSVQNGLRELEAQNAIVTVERRQRTGRGRKNLTNRYRISGGARFASGMVQNLHPKQETTPSAFDDLAMSIEVLMGGDDA
jgi:AraC-like DNA-binding protein